MASPQQAAPKTPALSKPLSPILKVVNGLMTRYPGDYSAHPPEGKDRIDRFLHLNDPVIDQPGGTKIQTPLIHPVTGALIHTGLGLQPTAGSTAGGALIGTGIKPGPGISRDQFITHLRQNDTAGPIKITPAVQAFLDAIEKTSLGVPADTLPMDEGVSHAAAALGTPITRLGNNLIHQGTAFPPLATGADAAMTAFARWLSFADRDEGMPSKSSVAGTSPSTGYPLTGPELAEIFRGHGNPAAQAALIRVLREGLLASDKQGSENN